MSDIQSMKIHPDSLEAMKEILSKSSEEAVAIQEAANARFREEWLRANERNEIALRFAVAGYAANITISDGDWTEATRVDVATRAFSMADAFLAARDGAK